MPRNLSAWVLGEKSVVWSLCFGVLHLLEKLKHRRLLFARKAKESTWDQLQHQQWCGHYIGLWCLLVASLVRCSGYFQLGGGRWRNYLTIGPGNASVSSEEVARDKEDRPLASPTPKWIAVITVLKEMHFCVYLSCISRFPSLLVGSSLVCCLWPCRSRLTPILLNEVSYSCCRMSKSLKR